MFDVKHLPERLVNLSISRPNKTGTLSGHAAGEPFDKLAYEELKRLYPAYTFRQYEYLNKLYKDNAQATSIAARHALFNSPAVGSLLNRGNQSTKDWTPTSQFEEKQNDTADILLTDGVAFDIVDVKTHNTTKAAQPPNIISSEKLLHLCFNVLEEDKYDHINIYYLGVGWEESRDSKSLICKECCVRSLFKIPPDSLYINWVAAQQIQFHVASVPQSYSNPTKSWAKEYAAFFIRSREAYLNKKMEGLARYKKTLKAHLS